MKNCAKCEKTVYPTEELKCLDKVWHKGCFRCWECNMMLSMKNYKGYDKLPYCTAHYPKPRHTQVADTPENRRLGENTKLQSQLQYHSEFEQAKGQYTAVADDPETLRNLQNQKVVSQNVYHSDFEQNKGVYTPVADDFDTLRARRNQKNISQLQYHEQFEQAKGHYTAVADDPETLRNLQNQKVVSQVKYHEEFEKAKGAKTSVVDDPETLRVRKIQDQVSQINYQDHMSKATMMERQRALIDSGDNMPQNMGGRDLHQPEFVQPAAPEPPPPQEVAKPSPYSGRTQGHTTVYNAGSKGGKGPKAKPSPKKPEPPRQAPQKKWGFRRGKQGPRYRAMYDYQAADDDEVSFLDGDVIINVQQIDEGWMTGTVERSRKSGMLPANYVERIS